jgi:sulfate/thiosulfate transport system ATP-binding protein
VSINLEQVSQHRGQQPVVNDVSLRIAEGELFALLGPAGSGKTALLRLIAGLSTTDHGRIVISGRDVTRLDHQGRGVGVVFPDHGLFAHLSAADNVEFALRARSVPAAERRRRRAELFELLLLEGLEDLPPAELSDIQRQRVALARALAHRPRVLLLDDPWAALYPSARAELVRLIQQVHRTLGLTTILAADEAEDACRIADRIGVMFRGRLLESGDPQALYTRPRTRFVATFLGEANLFLGRREGHGVRVGAAVIAVPWARRAWRPDAEATLLVRPEDLVLAPRGGRLPLGNVADGVIVSLQRRDGRERVEVALSPGQQVQLSSGPAARAGLLLASRSAWEAQWTPLAAGQDVEIGFRRAQMLPTPINSLCLVASSAAEVERLANAPLLRTLAENMQLMPARVTTDRPGQASPGAGLLVMRLTGPQSLLEAARLLEHGAGQVLLLRDGAVPIGQLLVYAQNSRAARESALSVAGSVLRHLPLEATLLVAAGKWSRRGDRYRRLLDLRSEALDRHGIDLRTELVFDDIAEEISRRVRASGSPTLLLVGLTSPATGRRLLEQSASQLLRGSGPAAVLLSRGGLMENPASFRHVAGRQQSVG